MAKPWEYTAYELAANRHEAYLIGIADTIRLLLGTDSAKASSAINLITLAYPEAARFIPVGSRPGEEKPRDRGEIAYRDGEVLYWRPGSVNMPDSVWMVPSAEK